MTKRIRVGGATWYVGSADCVPAFVARKNGWVHTVPACGLAPVLGSYPESMIGVGGVVFATTDCGARIPASGNRVEARIRAACKRAWQGTTFGLCG